LEGGAGPLAVWAARRGAEVHCYDGSIIASRLARETLAANAITDGVTVHDAALPAAAQAGTFDLALLPLPKGRAYARLLLGAARRALKPEARLYLAGPNAGGAKAVLKDAGAILGRSATVLTKARHRVGLALRLDDAPEADLSLEPHQFEAAGLTLFGLPGVFSRDGLDEGTALLLDTLDGDLCGGARLLDVGCGYGVIGLHAARQGASAVDMVDSAWLAVEMARRGIAANGLTDVCRAWTSDLYSDVPGETYDLIVSNPPFHAGHKVVTDAATALIAGARDRLSKGGALRLVANRFLPYDRAIESVFGRVTVVRENDSFRVLQAVR